MMKDWYLGDRARLNKQPKRTVGDYVAANGFLVPRRYNSLSEARNSRLPILARSEHPQDYDGSSGLIESLLLEDLPEVRTEDEIKSLVLFDAEERLSFTYIKRHCRLLGMDEATFRNQISFSFWERIPGANRKVVADSSIQGRYHITSFDWDKRVAQYTLIEDELPVLETPNPLPEDLRNFKGLIETYNAIRRLDRFDPNHCPLMEFQTFNGNNYFLQYHRTRDFSPVSFRLTDSTNKDWIKALIVRGSTPPDGITCRATLVYPIFSGGFILPENEEASFDMHANKVFSEIMTRRRKAQFIETQSLTRFGLNLSENHEPSSNFFKPEISVVINEGSLFSSEEYSELVDRSIAQDSAQELDFHIISDGRNCYIGRIER